MVLSMPYDASFSYSNIRRLSIRVIIITEYFYPGIGGLENSAKYLALALGSYFQVEILTPVQNTSKDELNGITVKRFNPDESPYEKIKSYLEKQECIKAVFFFGFSDIATESHLNLIDFCNRNLSAKVFLKIPSINEFSQYVTNEQRKRILIRLDMIICLNPAISKELKKQNIPASKIFNFKNGIPVDLFYPASHSIKKETKNILGIKGEMVFIFPGRFAGRKRIDMLIEAFKNVENTNLLLVGYNDKRFDNGTSLNIENCPNIQIFGPTHNLLPFLQASDVYISASKAEGMPNSLLEAMACGLPALVSDIPGHNEIVTDLINGRLFSSGNIDDLIDKIKWFIKNSDQLELMAKNARQEIVSNFNIHDIAKEYRKLILDGKE